ncbi:natriuretic peptide A-like [Lepisosteus oculatus]|uniref:Natriuretic peptide A-like n=1 Tax=Lepisosteus oculatus TaxID=7918 RepID=W5ME49_LEPOC|nr:PREDICTED: C-type natriuretic peptide 3-like [Lepisosteus oculatus]
MMTKVSIYCAVLVLLLNQIGAKPVSHLQTLTQLLEEERNPPYPASEEAEGEGDLTAENGAYNTASELPWNQNSRDLEQSANEDLMLRLFSDILTSSKRSWRRMKKGSLRSCFGVRLERIGSTSGLGC